MPALPAKFALHKLQRIITFKLGTRIPYGTAFVPVPKTVIAKAIHHPWVPTPPSTAFSSNPGLGLGLALATDAFDAGAKAKLQVDV
jgi:hypothetical protein